MQHICLKCQGPISVVDEVEAELNTLQIGGDLTVDIMSNQDRPSRKVCLMADTSILEQLRDNHCWIKATLANAIVDTIEAELIPDDLARETFRNKVAYSRFDCEDPVERKIAGTRLVRHIEDLARHAPKDSVDRVLGKWLGNTDRDQRISLEVLSRMVGNDRESNELLSAQQVASNLFHYWDSDVKAILQRLSIEDAKELCNSWYPLHEDQNLGNAAATPEELSSTAKSMIDKLGAGLRSGESLFPDEREHRKKVGDEVYFWD